MMQQNSPDLIEPEEQPPPPKYQIDEAWYETHSRSLEEMIASVQSEGGTVFFSTHLLHELERVADEVAILHQGRLRLRSSVEGVKSDVKQLRAIYPGTVPETFPIAKGVTDSSIPLTCVVVHALVAPRVTSNAATAVSLMKPPAGQSVCRLIFADTRTVFRKEKPRSPLRLGRIT